MSITAPRDLLADMQTAVEQAYQPRKFPRLDPDDARQEGLLACLRAVPKFDPARGCPVSYFRYAARWALIQAARRRAPYPAELVEPEAPEIEAPEGTAELARAVQRLKPRYREVILRRYWLGESQRHVADILGCTHQNVCASEERALKALRRLLGEERR